MRKKFGFFKIDRAGVLAKVARIVDTARKLLPVFLLDGKQEPHAYLRRVGDLPQGDTPTLAKRR
jgi:hypothetical protein